MSSKLPPERWVENAAWIAGGTWIAFLVGIFSEPTSQVVGGQLFVSAAAIAATVMVLTRGTVEGRAQVLLLVSLPMAAVMNLVVVDWTVVIQSGASVSSAAIGGMVGAFLLAARGGQSS